ncbi:MAG TPA: alpha/beta hydrolase [Gemmatimonadaceae bacterium]|jgi:predicted esterase|nr:alpha/beta hydrolase [Gemmatimonadaceae bacterium]
MSTGANEGTLGSHVHRWEPPTGGTGATLLLLHGTGGDESDLLPLGRRMLPGAGLLGVRGNVSEHGAPRFFRRLAEGVFDMDDLHRRTGELGDFVEAAAEHYGFDRSRVYAVGFSNGANIAASLLFSRPDALAGGVLLRAMVPFEPTPVPRLDGRAVLLGEGRFDPLIPAAQAERLASIFREAGADVVLEWQEAGHQLTPKDIRAAEAWFAARGLR